MKLTPIFLENWTKIIVYLLQLPVEQQIQTHYYYIP